MLSANTRAWLWLILTAAACLLIYALKPVLLPFLVAAAFAYLGDPVVDRLESWRMSRTFAVIVVFSGLSLAWLIVLVLMFPLIESQISILIRNMPAYLDWFQQQIYAIFGRFLPEGQVIDPQGIREFLNQAWSKAGGIMPQIFGTVSRSGGAIAAMAANVLLIPVITFYMLRDWDLMVERIRLLLPRRIEPVVSELAREADEVLGGFVRGQLLVMLALAVIYSLGLWIAGLDLALLIGLLSGIVSFVPYLGFIIGGLAAGVAIVVQTESIWSLGWVVGVYGVGQVLESTLLTPWLVGDRIGLHPIFVIFAVLAGGQLFGFFGVLLALPAAAVMAVVVRHFYDRWLTSSTYQKERASREDSV